MRRSLHRSILVILLCPAINAFAQYTGGAGDGQALATLTGALLGNNFFKGGIDDGQAMTVVAAQPLGQNIFKGGIDDGQAATLAVSQPLGQNIFKGGIDDGQAMTLAAAQPLGQNIFKGGIDDGQAATLAAAQPLGHNFFTGGADDGWAMGINSSTVNLPITLSSFTDEWQEKDALLFWSTETESNSDHFELQRSFDGSNFTPVANIEAAGTSNSVQNYQYDDKDVKTAMQAASRPTVYYRLRSVDKDGKDAYSGVVLLSVDLSGLAYSVFPNPARDMFNISVTGGILPGQTSARLFDVGGRLLEQIELTNNTQQVSVSRLASGIYFLQVITAGRLVYTQKIIIQK